ncbi:MAG: 4-(cytidine 5'-diphospho)-2-C-methyl-D-erythritol kinase [Gemmatimonadota bacterium]|nr:4-(cytidine 5'-diphospho)-2-C-methyl-D-erythritol kinase [Gemmatimonadota bacterium]MDH5284116.1 4-(cytidine 5'-diphospho)-2-C-methyl-D-erythritol kinase [Gemmatimonadota bacterium]
MNPAIRIPAHAKVNLFLRVLAREDDGFHSLETLFCLLSLADELQAERSDAEGVALEVEGGDCGPHGDNLAVRAAQMVLDATGRRFGVRLRLRKHIPVRAGLGGGSSDAAAALTAVNHLAGNAVPRHELLQMAARLGSDIPFLLTGASLALAWGHGSRLLRLPPLPTMPALVVIPETGISTPEAYREIDQARLTGHRRGAVSLDLESLARWGDIARLSGNDFEFALFGRHPDLKRAFEALAGTQPLLCRMSGSGSAMVAIYRSRRDRDDASLMLGARHGRVVAVETLEGPPAAPAEV